MKLEQDYLARKYKRVGYHDLDTEFVADQFEISRRRIQQLAKVNRESGEIPPLDTPGRKPYAKSSADLEARILEIYRSYDIGAEAVSNALRVQDGISIDTNRVHDILEKYDHVTANPNKQGRRRPWVRFVFDMIETESSSDAASVDLFDSVREKFGMPSQFRRSSPITGQNSSIPTRDERPCLGHDFEGYLHEHDIRHSLCVLGRPKSNGKIERFFQTYEKQIWRFDSSQEFLDFYNKERPHMSFAWDELETPYEGLTDSVQILTRIFRTSSQPM